MKMRKILAFFLSIFIMIPGFAISYAEDQALTEEARAINQYFDLFDAEKPMDTTVTRAEYATFIARLLNINEYARWEKTYYQDVPADNWASASINSLAEIGALTVGKDQKFRPDDLITLPEAVKVLLNLMGYEKLAEQKGGYPGGYLSEARTLKLLEHVRQTGDFTLADAGNLIADAAECEAYESYLEDGKLHFGPKKDKTLLSVYRDMYSVKGTVQAVNRAALYAGNELDRTMLIDGLRYDYDGDESYLGCYVKAYYIQKKGDDPKIAFLVDLTEDESIIDIDAKNLEEFDEDYILHYFRNGQANRTSSVRIDRGASFVYNGAAIDTKILEHMNIKKGSIRIIKTKDSGSFNVVLIREYENYIAGYIDQERKTVHDLVNSVRTIDLSGEDETVRIFDSTGNSVGFTAIGEKNILSVYRSAGNLTEVYLSETRVEGKLESIQNDTDEQGYVISGTDYPADEDYFDAIAEKVQIGMETVFLLDWLGNVVYVDDVTSSDQWIYGYFINQRLDSEEEDLLMIKLYSEQAGLKRYQTAEKVKIDGVRSKKAAVISEKLSESMQLAENIYLRLLDHPTNVIPRLIRYKLDAEGKICEIDTPYTSSKEIKDDALVIDDVMKKKRGTAYVGQSIRVIDGVAIVGYKTVVNKTTIQFTVPEDVRLQDASEKSFKITRNGASLGKDFDMISYKTSPEHGASDVLVYISRLKESMYSEDSFVVSSITQTIDADDTPIECIDGYRGTTAVSFTVASDATTWTREEKMPSEAGIERGDIVMAIFNSSGEISQYQLVYDCSEQKCYNLPSVPAVMDEDGTTELETAKDARIVFTNSVADSADDFYNCFYNRGTFTQGWVKSLNEGMVGISFAKGGAVKTLYPVGEKPILVIDTKAKKDGFSVGTISDIASYEKAGGNCSVIVAVHSYAEWEYSYIYHE